jgi:hypothetical protein
MELVKFKNDRKESHHVVSIYRGLVFVTCPHYTNSPLLPQSSVRPGHTLPIIAHQEGILGIGLCDSIHKTRDILGCDTIVQYSRQ